MEDDAHEALLAVPFSRQSSSSSTASRRFRHGPDSTTLFDAYSHQGSTLGHKKLLLRSDTIDWGDDALEDSEVLGTCTHNAAVSNFSMTLMGCGIMALPKVFASTGIALGLLGMVATYCLTVASANVLVRMSHSTGIMSYAEMVRLHFGSIGAVLLQGSIILNNMGVMVVYFIMMADLLIGTPPTYQGVLPTLLHDHTNPWFLSRWLWITIIACFFEGPLLYLRDLGALLWASTASIACSIFFSLALTAVACVAAWQGKLAHFFVGPDPELTGQGVGGIAVTWVGVLPVIALAFICHFNVLPIKASLIDKQPQVMLSVIAVGTLLISIIYSVVAVAGYVLFGRHTPGNVFTDLTAEYVATLLGENIAQAVVIAVKLPVIYMLIITYVLKNWGVRECVSELLFDCESLKLPLHKFYGITILTTIIVYVLAIVLPNVFVVMLFVGSTACVLFSYVFPGMLMMVEEEGRRVHGWALIGVGVAFMVLGLQRAIAQAMSGG